MKVPASNALSRVLRNINNSEPRKALSHKEQTNPSDSFQVSGIFNILKVREYLRVAQRSSLDHLAWQFRHCNSHDPRDMVFGLSGLTLPTEGLANWPDYHLDVETVSSQLVRSSISQESKLNILNYAALSSSSGSKSPSWVRTLRWNNTFLERIWEKLGAFCLVPFHPAQHFRFRGYDSSKSSTPRGIPDPNRDNELLTLRGFLVDKIFYLGFQPSYSTLGERDVIVNTRAGSFAQQAAIKKWYQHISLDSEDMTVDPSEDPEALKQPIPRTYDSFWRTIVADSTFEDALNFEGISSSTTVQRGYKPENSFYDLAERYVKIKVFSLNITMKRMMSNLGLATSPSTVLKTLVIFS